MSSSLKFKIKSSKSKGLATMNDIFAASGLGARNHYDATNQLKKQMMDHVVTRLKKAILTKELMAKDIMTPEAHIFIAIHPASRGSDIDNVSTITKWVTDAMEGLRVNVLDDGSLEFEGWFDPHSKSGRNLKSTLKGVPFLPNDNMTNILDIHPFYAGTSKEPYADVIWTSDWDEYDQLLMQMSKAQRNIKDLELNKRTTKK